MSQESEYGDPLSAPFWDAAREQRLVIQKCSGGHWQHFPRPFCITCMTSDLTWTEVSGRGKVYAHTTVHMVVREGLTPPYKVGIVELAEGPRLLAAIHSSDAVTGDDVELCWEPSTNGAPPMPAFAMPGDSR